MGCYYNIYKLNFHHSRCGKKFILDHVCLCTHRVSHLHTLDTLLGTPVQLLGNKLPITWQQLNAFRHLDVVKATSLKFKLSIRMGKKGDLSDFERGMVVGARWLVWVFQKLLIYWDFHTQPSLGFTENGPKKRKYPVSGSCVDENVLLMSEVRGEWADWLEMIERQQ